MSSLREELLCLKTIAGENSAVLMLEKMLRIFNLTVERKSTVSDISVFYVLRQHHPL